MQRVQISVDINAHIANIEHSIHVDSDAAHASISFDNLGFGTITAIKLIAQGYNAFGDSIQVNGKNEFFLLLQDLRVERNSHIENLDILLPDASIRQLDLEEYQIRFADGTIIKYAGADVEECAIWKFGESDREKTVLSAIQDELGSKILYLPQRRKHGWVCGCGRYNKDESTVCTNCENKKDIVLQLTSAEYISALEEKHHRKEEIRRELAKRASQKRIRDSRIRTLKVWLRIVVAIGIIVLVSFAAAMASRSTYSSIDEMQRSIEGVYTYYDEDEPREQLYIQGDSITLRWLLLGSNHDSNRQITSWNPQKGAFVVYRDTLIVTDAGNIKYDGKQYFKGGTWEENVQGILFERVLDNAFHNFDITYTSVHTDSNYTICTGSLKNTGSETYIFVELKGAFKDEVGNVIDTDWTYAVGVEGLAPDESTSFRLSVPKNKRIVSCSVSVLEYDKK